MARRPGAPASCRSRATAPTTRRRARPPVHPAGAGVLPRSAIADVMPTMTREAEAASCEDQAEAKTRTGRGQDRAPPPGLPRMTPMTSPATTDVITTSFRSLESIP